MEPGRRNWWRGRSFTPSGDMAVEMPCPRNILFLLRRHCRGILSGPAHRAAPVFVRAISSSVSRSSSRVAGRILRLHGCWMSPCPSRGEAGASISGRLTTLLTLRPSRLICRKLGVS